MASRLIEDESQSICKIVKQSRGYISKYSDIAGISCIKKQEITDISQCVGRYNHDPALLQIEINPNRSLKKNKVKGKNRKVNKNYKFLGHNQKTSSIFSNHF